MDHIYFSPLTAAEFESRLKERFCEKKSITIPHLKNRTRDNQIFLLKNIPLTHILSKISLAPYETSEHIFPDIGKVSFDTENFTVDPMENYGYGENLIGIHELANGFSFLGCAAGGDWEYPVFFIIYWDGFDFRAYVPIKGNLVNSTTFRAYSNDLNMDIADFKRKANELAIKYEDTIFQDSKTFYKFLDKSLCNPQQILDGLVQNSIPIINASYLQSCAQARMKPHSDYLDSPTKDVMVILRANNIDPSCLSVKKRFDLDEGGQLLSIDLANLNLETFLSPEDPLEHVVTLNLSHNRLETTGFNLKMFPNLKILDFSFNSLQSIPEAIGHLQCLAELKMDHNRLTAVPANFPFPASLETLSLANNALTTMPSLKMAPSLNSLDLSSNQLTIITPALQDAYTALKSLNISNNPITSISEDLRYYPNLFVVDLSATHLENMAWLGDGSNGPKIIILSEELLPSLVRDFRKYIEILFCKRKPFKKIDRIPEVENVFLQIIYPLFYSMPIISPSPIDFIHEKYVRTQFFKENEHITEFLFGNIKNSDGDQYIQKEINITHEAPLDFLGIDYEQLYGKNFWIHFPPEIRNLTQLKKLAIYDSYLTQSLPLELGMLKHLEFFKLISKNPLTLPPTFPHLSTLKTLYIEAPISEIAFCLAAFKNLEELTLITDLDNFPAGLNELGRLKKLEIRPYFSEKPKKFNYQTLGFQHLGNLEVIILQDLGLTGLDESISQVKRIKHLDVSGNNFMDLPEDITRIIKNKEPGAE